MKKNILPIIILIFLIFIYINKSKLNGINETWLNGCWKSSDWNVTYSFLFNEEDSTWSIKTKEYVVCEAAHLNKENKDIVLTDKNGTRFYIEKKDNTHIYFQQAAAEGLVGLTNCVEFVKISDKN